MNDGTNKAQNAIIFSTRTSEVTKHTEMTLTLNIYAIKSEARVLVDMKERGQNCKTMK